MILWSVLCRQPVANAYIFYLELYLGHDGHKFIRVNVPIGVSILVVIQGLSDMVLLNPRLQQVRWENQSVC